MSRDALKTQEASPQPATAKGPWQPPGRPSRTRLALALVLGAAVFACIGALGPAHRLTATYSWPPAALPVSAKPTRLWYSPLLLTRGIPAKLHATIPCRGLAPPLQAGERTSLVLSTMRHPEAGPGLAVLRSGDRLDFRVGASTFATASASPGTSCSPVVLDIRGNQWSLRASPTQMESGSFAGDPPRVTGLFTGLDLRNGARPGVVVTTVPYAARAAWWQWPVWLLALALAFAALVVGFGTPLRRRRAQAGSGTTLTRSLRRLTLVDGAVVLLVGAWWLIGPVLYDDGWVKARQTNGLIGDGFSNYYTTYGVNLPLDFWTEWLQHWVVARSSVLLVQRIPTLVLLAATWIVCRTVLRRLLAGERSRAAEWALGLAFVLNVFAWGMTLRPEPFVALLVVSVFSLAVRFIDEPSGWRLAGAGALVALALAAHPAGLIALAPLLVIGPHIVRWARDRGWAASVLVVAAPAAFFLTAFTASSDLRARLSEGRLARTAGDATASWRGELSRYEFAGGSGTTLRHLSVALMLAAVIGYLARGRRPSRLDLAGASLALTLILLIATPSKWAWHFGALLGLAALAVGSEIARLRADSRIFNWPVRPVLAFCLAILVVSWSLGFTEDWSYGFSLRTLHWTFGFEQRVTLVRLGLLGFALVFAAFVLLGYIRHGRAGAWRSPWSIVPWLVPLVVLPLSIFTLAMFAIDAVKTPDWTLPRQNIDSLHGRAGCGLADNTLVAAPGSFRPLLPVGGQTTATEPPWLARSSPPSRPTFALLDDNARARLVLPWFKAPAGRRVGFYILGTRDDTDHILARWGSPASSTPSEDWSGIDVSHSDIVQTETVQWIFVPEGLLPERLHGSTAVQLALQSDALPAHALASTGALSYKSTRLSDLFRKQGATAVVWPNLLLYMPCARQPDLTKGVVGVPNVLVANSGFFTLEFPTSPFHGLIDLYGLRDLGVADSRLDPPGVTVLWVDRQVPGAALAPAEQVGS